MNQEILLPSIGEHLQHGREGRWDTQRNEAEVGGDTTVEMVRGGYRITASVATETPVHSSKGVIVPFVILVNIVLMSTIAGDGQTLVESVVGPVPKAGMVTDLVKPTSTVLSILDDDAKVHTGGRSLHLIRIEEGIAVREVQG